MRVFVSYASEDRSVAEEIVMALRGEGHDVFFDTTDLRAGAEFNERIREAVRASDRVVFLVSPDSVAGGRYTLSELALVEEKWAHPRGRVLPVVVRPTTLETVPAYLRSVTLLEPSGNVAAEVAMWLPRRSGTRRWVAAVAVVVVGVLGAWMWVLRPTAAPFAEAAGAVVEVSSRMEATGASVPLGASGLILLTTADSLFVVTTSRVVAQDGRRIDSVRVSRPPLLQGAAARVRNVDGELRLALLTVPRPPGGSEGSVHPIPLGSPGAIEAGDRVLPLVCRDGSCGDLPPEPGRVTSVDSLHVRFSSSWVGLGTAGGGLYDERSGLIGMITSEVEALRADRIRQRLTAWEVNP